MRASSRLFAGLPRLALALSALAALPALAQSVYQWKDASGVTHYSDKPPSGEQYQDRRIAAHGEPVPQTDPAGKSVESPQCITARKNLEILKAPAPVRAADSEGKPGKVLDDSERASQRALAEAAEKAYCSTPAG